MTQPRKRTNSLRPFVLHLSEMAASLPSSVEIAAAKVALDDIIAFLQHTRASLDERPTCETAGSIAQSIQVCDRLLDSAQKNATVGLALGLTPTAGRRVASRPTTEQDELPGRETFDQLAR